MTEQLEEQLEQEVDERPRAPIELRSSGVKVGNVDFAQRLITVVAVPYEEPGLVEYRSELWHEIFERGAFDGIEKRPNRVRANRDHDKSRTVGKALRFYPDRTEGLVTELRIAQTPLGDETLALADDDCLSASVGYAAFPHNQVMNRRGMTRRIKKAFLDHIAFVEDPAYKGAQVLSVRGNNTSTSEAANLAPIVTPSLDAFAEDPLFQWARERLSGENSTA